MIRCLTTALAAAVVASPASAQQEVGRAVAITVDVTGAGAADARTIKSGDGIFENERIETDAKGTGQFELLDQTRLAVGPGSSVKLDRFVYDANRKATTVAIELGRGAFRFISGKSASKAYSIVTPTATLGVRGTAFDVYLAPAAFCA